tara:strand:- start:132 stop:440 length:309 start_codon:yes stop_codon:yes gene_type:complete
LVLLPNNALIYSIGFDLCATFVIWSIGPILLSESSKKLVRSSLWNNFIKALSCSPAVKGLIGALIVKLIGLPIFMLIISLIIRLPSIMRDALFLQAAAPTAI